MKNNNFDSCNNGLESLQKPSLYLGRHREVSPVCPKPRRLAASLPDFILPDKCTKHSQSSPGEYCEIMDIITNKAMDHHKSLSLMAVSLYFFAYEAVALLLVPLSGNHFEDKLCLIIVFLVPHIFFSIFVCLQLKVSAMWVLETLSPTNNGSVGDGRFSQAGYQTISPNVDDIDKMVEEAVAATKRKEESELKNVTLEALEALKKGTAKYEEDRVAWEGEKATYEEECQRWQEERLGWEDEIANLEEDRREWEYERQGWEQERADLETRRQEWEKESERRRKDREAELDAVRKCAKLYPNVLHDYNSFNPPQDLE
ncbi:hypothetical protein Sjap_009882 [Stephania japonica]|uniref:Uncharacterized protein n=1 Tax=Stephania japonica TaxID=461633 RepID=A0AAP0J9D5_9MAGN